MKRRFVTVVPLVALPFVLSGCFWFGGSRVVEGSAAGEASDAATYVRAAIPAIEAYYADNGTYERVTTELLQKRYDARIVNVEVVEAAAETYCIESDLSDDQAHKRGPGADVQPGLCP